MRYLNSEITKLELAEILDDVICRVKILEDRGADQPARVMPCPAFVLGEHCAILPIAMCPDEPCDLSRA